MIMCNSFGFSSPPTHLDLPSSEERVVEGHGRADGVLVGELHVGETLGVTVEFVAQDRHAVDGSATVEVLREKKKIVMV